MPSASNSTNRSRGLMAMPVPASEWSKPSPGTSPPAASIAACKRAHVASRLDWRFRTNGRHPIDRNSMPISSCALTPGPWPVGQRSSISTISHLAASHHRGISAHAPTHDFQMPSAMGASEMEVATRTWVASTDLAVAFFIETNDGRLGRDAVFGQERFLDRTHPVLTLCHVSGLQQHLVVGHLEMRV